MSEVSNLNTLNISSEIQQMVVDGAKKRGLTPDIFLSKLMAEEEERLRLLTISEEEVAKRNAPAIYTQKITRLCQDYFAPLTSKSEMFEIGTAVEKIYQAALKQGLLSVKTKAGHIVESRRIKVEQVNYFHFGGALAKRIAMWFGTMDVYLNFSLCPQEEMLFVGMPNNAEISIVVFEFFYRLFCTIKKEYKKSLGKRFKKSEMENFTNRFLYVLSTHFDHVEAWIGEEEDETPLFDYVEEHYRYALN